MKVANFIFKFIFCTFAILITPAALVVTIAGTIIMTIASVLSSTISELFEYIMDKNE